MYTACWLFVESDGDIVVRTFSRHRRTDTTHPGFLGGIRIGLLRPPWSFCFASRKFSAVVVPFGAWEKKEQKLQKRSSKATRTKKYFRRESGKRGVADTYGRGRTLIAIAIDNNVAGAITTAEDAYPCVFGPHAMWQATHPLSRVRMYVR